MALTFGQLTFGTAAVSLLTVPPGACNVTITTTAGTAYLGGARAGTATGYILPSGQQVRFETYPGSTGGTVTAAGGGSPVSVSWAVATAA